MNRTVCIQIGNSDDKLTQQEWCYYATELDHLCYSEGETIHFKGGPPTIGRWQNFCVVLEVEDDRYEVLKAKVADLRAKYGQDSVAWLEGTVEFV